MLGEFVDEYTVRVVDVFAMPQSGTGVSVEAVDPVFQTDMLDMLKQVGRWEISFHSTPLLRQYIYLCLCSLLRDIQRSGIHKFFVQSFWVV